MGRRPLPTRPSGWVRRPFTSWLSRRLPRIRRLVLLRRASGHASEAHLKDEVKKQEVKEEVKKRRRMALKLKLALSTPYPSSYPVQIAALQDADYVRFTMGLRTQNSKPPAPPDPIVVPRGTKNRHPKKHKPRAGLPPGPGIIHEVADLHRSYCWFNFITHSVSRLDSICNGVVIPESVYDGLARLDVDSCANCDNAVDVPDPNMVVPNISRATSNPSPHLPLPPPPPYP